MTPSLIGSRRGGPVGTDAPPPPGVPKRPARTDRNPLSDGLAFGFLFRLAAATLAVAFGAVLLAVVGLFTAWTLHPWMLWLYGALVAAMVLLAEHFRSEVYERLETRHTRRAIDSAHVDQLLADLGHPAETHGVARTQRILKRAVDLVAASTFLVVLSPALLVIALLIRWDSRGPVFFKERRLGAHGRPFGLLRFRTMPARDWQMVDLDESTKVLGPHPTRAGAFLRRTALDELPQLFNVLWGDMSLVGPRPLRERDLARGHGHEAELLRRILAIRPGMTSASSLLAARGGWERLRQIDLQFHETPSLTRDIKVLILTVPAVLRRSDLSD